MANSDNTVSAIDSIDSVAFKIGLRGYGVDEVDEFLERLSTEVRQMKDLVEQQRQQLRQAAQRISQLDARGPATAAATPPPAAPAPSIRDNTGSSVGAEQVTSMIALAQRFIEDAQQEAEAKAHEFTAAAQERAREIVAEARSRAEDEVNRLNGLKQRLSEDVETLTQQLQSEKTRIAGVLAEFTRWVDQAFQSGSSSRPAVASAPAPAPLSAPEPAPAPAASPRPMSPPPAAAPASPTIGQVLNFDQGTRDDR